MARATFATCWHFGAELYLFGILLLLFVVFLSLSLLPPNRRGKCFALVYWLGNWLETGLREKFLIDCDHNLWVGWVWLSDQLIRFGG